MQTPAANRPARFLRIEKAVSQPNDDLRDIDNTAFGVTTQFGMKEIVGYAMIEPDGSVVTKVPANAALMISVVDENGMRITQRHRNWISVASGQELKCTGCHDDNASRYRMVEWMHSNRLRRRDHSRWRSVPEYARALVHRRGRRNDGRNSCARQLQSSVQPCRLRPSSRQ